MISRITISSLLSVSMSINGRLPALRATSRFWIKVESLNRPPTLLTISSSRSSSSIRLGLQVLQNLLDLVDRPSDRAIDYSVLIAIGIGQLAAGNFQASLDRLFGIRLPAAEPPLQHFERFGL